MIIGIGSDLVDIRRIEKTLVRFGERFEQRFFTAEEQAKARRRSAGIQRNNTASTYAKRFAAKEACAKALGTSFRSGVSYKNIAVVNLDSNKPSIVLSGGAQVQLYAMLAAGQQPTIHLTMTDEYPLAQAFVVIEALRAE
jgi:holo-[acyl-carrier protein] synthase